TLFAMRNADVSSLIRPRGRSPLDESGERRSGAKPEATQVYLLLALNVDQHDDDVAALPVADHRPRRLPVHREFANLGGRSAVGARPAGHRHLGAEVFEQRAGYRITVKRFHLS